MQQAAPTYSERRRDPRVPKAFALWLCPLPGARRLSAWMLDMSAGGAALLTDAREAPPVGQRVELSEMVTPDRIVREGATPLPRYARVIRHDDSDGLVRRIAVRFEADEPAIERANERHTMVAACPRPPLAPPVPPPRPLDPALLPSIPAEWA